MTMQKYISGKLGKIALLTLVCLVAASLVALADRPNPHGVANKTLNATLYKKALGQVTDTFGQRYMVNRSTLIINTDGHQIPLSDLSVPCDVSLKTVGQGKGDPLAVRIKVLHLHPGANYQMGG